MDNDKLQQIRGLYHFGAFRLDAAERRLWCVDEPISLTPKQFDLLFYFVENAGRVAKKSELLDAVWTDTYIEEATLARNVSWLRNKLSDCEDDKLLIETVSKLGYRFTAEVTRSENNGNALIIEEQTVQHFRGEEVITIDDADLLRREEEKKGENTNLLPQNVPSSRRSLFSLNLLFIGIVLVALVGIGFTLYRNNFKTDAPTTGSNISEKVTGKNITVDATQNTSEEVQIKVGSIVHLRNQSSNEAGYLDAWGLVRNKPEFVRQVPTETMFVSTHQNSNRESGSGSWEIVSATGKKNNETLVYGDEIHLRSRHPDADYLDNCGWIIDMPIYKDFVGVEKFAVFTTYSKDRDNGTGTWVVKSDTKSDGIPVLEGDGISLENGFPGGGYLDTAGRVSNIPAFNDYDGSLLVFIHESTTSSRPNSGVWTISISKAALK